MIHSGVLKTARLEVASHLPEIAPNLRKHPDAVRRALQDVIAENNFDPKDFSSVDLNKAERHTYIMFGFDQMMRGFMKGRDYESHFVDPRSLEQKIIGNPFTLWGRRVASYQRNLVGMMITRRDEVKREFTEGNNAAHRWWQFANARYTNLGRELVQSEADTLNINDEAISLDFALAGSNLAYATHQHAEFIGNKRDYISLSRRVQAAHDLAYLSLALSDLNVLQIRSPERVPLPLLNVKVTFDSNAQKHGIERRDGADDNWNDVFYARGKTDVATLGCPAENALTPAFHAAINMGADYGLFRYPDPLC